MPDTLVTVVTRRHLSCSISQTPLSPFVHWTNPPNGDGWWRYRPLMTWRGQCQRVISLKDISTLRSALATASSDCTITI